MTPPLVVWTARLAAGCWLVRWLVEVPHNRRAGSSAGRALPRVALLWWTAGCGFHLAHVAAAYHWVHNWSHAAAWEHTAQRTAALAGVHWGGGVWLNDLFTLLWPLDVVRLWVERSTGRSACPKAIVRGWHVFSLAMMISATVIFGPFGWRAIALLVVLLWWHLRRRSRATDARPS